PGTRAASIAASTSWPTQTADASFTSRSDRFPPRPSPPRLLDSEGDVGLLTGLLTLPLAPVRGTIWYAEQLVEEAERLLNDHAVIDERLDEGEAAVARGELTQEE